MRSNDEKDLDSLLEEGLSSYSSQEPRPGLELRVLNRLRNAGPSVRFVFPRWAFAIPALACGLVLFAWLHTLPVQQPVVQLKVTQQKVAPEAPTFTEAAIIPASRVQVERKPRSVAKRAPLPKLQQFPSPAPITKEERALLAFVARSPDKAREILIDDRPWAAEPIRIKEINIQSLQIDGSL
jgi:hypothetical protein